MDIRYKMCIQHRDKVNIWKTEVLFVDSKSCLKKGGIGQIDVP